MKKELYILSGLGADESVFYKLEFSNYSVTFIEWIPPLQNETIENYASRLLNQIPSQRPTIVGLSFGGMLAIEIAKLIDTERIILIASAKTKTEIPFYYRLAGKCKLHKLLPSKLLKSSNIITYWLFGTSSREDQILFKQILNNTDPLFLIWAIDKIVHWTNEVKINNLFHIHGTSDRIIPIRFVKPDISITNGGHLMTLDKSDQINKILNQQLLKNSN